MKTNKPESHYLPMRSERILVVDDDIGICECVHWILQQKGYECVVTNTGAAGLAKLQNCEFDLVITDLKLPRHERVRCHWLNKGNGTGVADHPHDQLFIGGECH